MTRRLAGLALFGALLLGSSPPARAQDVPGTSALLVPHPPVQATPPGDTPPTADTAPAAGGEIPPWMFPAEPAMLEYVLLPGTESCRDEEHFRLELAIERDYRRDKEFLPFDAYDDERALVRITLSRTAAGKFQAVVDHLPPAGKPAAPREVRVNSECRDLVRDVAFLATKHLPFLRRPACVTEGAPPAPAAPCSLPPSSAAPAMPPGSNAPLATVSGPKTVLAPGGAACDPDRDGDPANDRACKRLLARLGSKYGPPVDFSLLGGGLMTLAYTSDPGAGLLLGGQVRGEHWSVALEVQTTLPAEVRPPQRQDLTSDSSTIVGLLVPCVRFGKTVEFVGCGVVGGGVYFNRDSQREAGPQMADTFRIGPRAGLEVPLWDRLSFFAAGEVTFAPVQAQILYRGQPLPAASWLQDRASVFVYAGLSVRLTGGSQPAR